MYKQFEAENLTFYVKYDLLNGEYIPHMFYRHGVEPEEAITAFFNITEQEYNPTNMRYEALSQEMGIKIYYTYKHGTNNKILLITALKENK